MLILIALLSLLVFVVPVRYKYALTLGVICAGVIAAIAVAVFVLADLPVDILPAEKLLSPLFGYIVLYVDRLSAIFLLIISVAVFSVTLYARDYVKAYTGRKSPAHLSVHYFSLMAMFFSMLFVVMFRSGFGFLVAWEIMTLASFLLILFRGEKRETRRAGINYLILMHIGFIFLVVGFVVGGSGTLDGFDSLSAYFSRNDNVPLFVVFLVGFGMKAGIFPLHVWLPVTYTAAPSYVAGCMSGVMSKLGIYGILRVLSTLDSDLRTIGIVLLAIGIVTALWGITQAVLQNDLKKLLACSSIENIGIIVTGIGAGVLGLSAGNQILALLCFSGALLHIINHSLFKPLLFMGAGSVGLGAHTRNLEELGGLSKQMPITTVLFLCGALAICALPPFNGFVSEFLIYLGLLKSTAAGSLVIWSVAAMAVLALVGGVVLIVFGKAFGIGFLGAPRSVKARQAKEVPVLMLVAQMIPLAGIILIGVFPSGVLPLLETTISEIFQPKGGWEFGLLGEGMDSLFALTLTLGVFILLLIALWLWRRQVQKNRVLSESPTWGCGFTAPTAKMEYTGESFSEGFEHMGNSPTNARSYKNRRAESVPKEEIFARPHEFGVEHNDRVDRIVSDRWAYLVRKVNARLALFQTGKINHYILHALLFLALVFLITWIGLI